MQSVKILIIEQIYKGKMRYNHKVGKICYYSWMKIYISNNFIFC